MATQDARTLQPAGKNLTGTAHEAEKASKAEERPQFQDGVQLVPLQPGQQRDKEEFLIKYSPLLKK